MACTFSPFPRRMMALLCAALVVLGLRNVTKIVMAEDPTQCTHGHAACSQCGVCCCPLVECTVMVPMTVTETRVQNYIVWKHVDREETYTVFRRVPEKQEFKKECWYLDDEVETKKIKAETCHLVNNPAIQTYRVNVPHCEIETPASDPCMEDACPKTVVRLRKEVRTNDCERPQLVFETNTCTIDYCKKVPKKYEIPCMEETTYKLVPESRTRTVSACVPVVMRKPVDVTVQRMVPKTVVCCPACAAKLRHQHVAAGSHSHQDGGLKGKLKKKKHEMGKKAVKQIKDAHKRLEGLHGKVKDAVAHLKPSCGILKKK